jgi:hypothetical protein
MSTGKLCEDSVLRQIGDGFENRMSIHATLAIGLKRPISGLATSHSYGNTTKDVFSSVPMEYIFLYVEMFPVSAEILI